MAEPSEAGWLRFFYTGQVMEQLLKWGWRNTRSWRTTLAGVAQGLLALGVIAGYLGADDIENTGQANEAIRTLVGLLFALSFVAKGWVSRDAVVSSRTTGIR
jgi:hypothetical protein